MNTSMLSIARLTSLGLELRRRTICVLIALPLAAPCAWAGLNEGVQAYKKQDYAKALVEFRSLAEQGNTNAQYNLGQMYRLGHGVLQNDAEAVTWYLLAAAKGDADAQYNLGQMYRMGIGVAQDNVEAAKWYRLAASQGYADARAKLKVMKKKKQLSGKHAKAVKRADISAPKKVSQKRAKTDPVHDKVLQNDSGATTRIRQAAAQGEAEAQSNLGIAYALGQGVPQDFNEAAKWFRLAAEQGDANAQYNLGVSYYEGKGIARDLKAALYWFEQAASAGQSYAQVNLGWGYMSNYLELNPDYRLAMSWNLKAANQGAGEGSANIGLLYEKGLGVPVNYVEAANWYKHAIGQGVKSGRAEFQLGGLYQNGLGVERDLDAAAILYRSVLQKFGDGEFADAARTRLDSIQN